MTPAPTASLAERIDAIAATPAGTALPTETEEIVSRLLAALVRERLLVGARGRHFVGFIDDD